MEEQMISVPLPRSVLKPDDLQLDENGNLIIDKKLLTKLVKENIHNIPESRESSVSVSVSVSF